MNEMTNIVKLIILNSPEELRGSNGRNIRCNDPRDSHASRVDFIDMINGIQSPGVMVYWRKKDFSPTYIPMASIKSIEFYSVVEAKKLGIYKEPVEPEVEPRSKSGRRFR